MIQLNTMILLGQNPIKLAPLEPDQSFRQVNYGKITLNKPLNTAVTYTLRFQGFQISDSLKSKIKYNLIIEEHENTKPIKKTRVPYADVIQDSIRKSDAYLDVAINIPKEYYSLGQKRFNLELDVFKETKPRSSWDYEFLKGLSLTVLIDFEQPDTLTLAQWNSGTYPKLEVVHVRQNQELLIVRAHDKNSRLMNTYTIRMMAHEKFQYQTPAHKGTVTFGIMTIPLKSYQSRVYFNEMVQTNFLNIAFHVGLLNNEIHTFRTDGHYNKKTIGAGLFLHPSYQTVSRLRFTSPEVFYTTLEEPYKAPFLGLGIDLNVGFNGLTLHLIPLAFDFQLDQGGNSRAAQSHVWWFGMGIGYSPKGRFSN